MLSANVFARRRLRLAGSGPTAMDKSAAQIDGDSRGYLMRPLFDLIRDWRLAPIKSLQFIQVALDRPASRPDSSKGISLDRARAVAAATQSSA